MSILDQLGDTFDRFFWRFRAAVPFTAAFVVRRQLAAEAASILDVGCGTGEAIGRLAGPVVGYTVGADIYWPYLLEARNKRSHQAYVQCDVRRLPFRAASFDIVMCLEVVEHLDRTDGLEMLRHLERIARRKVILTTPSGYLQQHEYDGNPYQAHRHGWTPKELAFLGYDVTIVGMRWLSGMAGVQSPLPRWMHPLVRVAWVLSGPLVDLVPKWGGAMVCVKTVTPSSE